MEILIMSVYNMAIGSLLAVEQVTIPLSRALRLQMMMQTKHGGENTLMMSKQKLSASKHAITVQIILGALR